MTVRLRPATADDEYVLGDMERECFSHPHWSGADFLKYRCTVAAIEQMIVGFLVVRDVFEDRSGAARNDSEYEILNIGVRPPYRRLGVATQLLRNEVSKPGTYHLEVRESNGPAQQLYLRLGFLPVGRRIDYYHAPAEDAIVMSVKRC